MVYGDCFVVLDEYSTSLFLLVLFFYISGGLVGLVVELKKKIVGELFCGLGRYRLRNNSVSLFYSNNNN